jgi:toxin ParE1/3/4
MDRYRVSITDEALAEMEQIYRYIAEVLQSPGHAMAQYDRIAQMILTLDTFPQRFRLMETELERARGIRRLNVDNYAVFFVIRENQVIVTDVLYGASDIEERLKG